MKRKLPKSGSIEAIELAKQYDAASSREKTALAIKYNVAQVSLCSWRSRKGPKCKDVEQLTIECSDVDKDRPIIVLPDFNLKEYSPIKTTGHAEEQGLIISDGHAGKITKSFNPKIYEDRMEKIFNKTITIKKLHEQLYPVNKLHIICLGDNVQGENPYQGSKIGEILMGARDQVIKLALPAWLKLIYSLKQHYSEIYFHGFLGNHGKVSKESPETSNWDLMLYDILKNTVNHKDIHFTIHENFGDIIQIQNSRFFCTHGDGTTSSGGVPWMALSRKIKSWHMQYKSGFEYVVVGHFHTSAFVEVGRDVEMFMNSTIVSDDDWALNKLGVSSTPSQWTFGVHPTHGVTWHYLLDVTNHYG